ncbi:Mitochondrial chaperone Frataxin [Podila epigama]|nr:Mitochondrial chaperone Frataxin [Podila epigama]
MAFARTCSRMVRSWTTASASRFTLSRAVAVNARPATTIAAHQLYSSLAIRTATPAFAQPSRLQTQRCYSSKPEPQYTISDLSDDEYHSISDASMDRMVEYFEDLGDEHEIPGYDVEYQSGVMTLKLGDKGTYVVNKQPPNKQLWLSSPTSGPKRYDYDKEHETWFYGRDHHSLKYLLDTEITKAIGIKINVPLDREL